MGWLKNIWEKTSFHKNNVERKEEEEFTKKLRAEVKEEMKDEIKDIMKEQIKEEERNKIINKTSGKKENKALDMLKKMGEEFKGSNVGSTEKLNQLLGKQPQQSNVNNKKIVNSVSTNTGNTMGSNLKDTNKLVNMIGVGKSRVTEKDYGSMLGSKRIKTDINIPDKLNSKRTVRTDYKDMLGVQEAKRVDVSNKIGGLAKKKGDDKIKEMLGKK